ncbi:ESX secretion-associated protein EspG [Amycolatopsis sp., V23-08]|uniref:ESX secretion-associated protein EspG n=1 Tax=Amycolatopsis heterodermiae TaxID=3110235 RepID=A0ABU5QYI6_9PSEU|nr:ESX secretion-associated protein EspG [Amycolatopsis sp., V23-08]MEA5358982.1 ESX secretion-associated protein EspG [Amycolatopsis sp., V23-08]
MPEEFALGLNEVDVAVRRTGLPASWHPFEIRSAGHTLEEHDRLAAESWEALRARGLAGPDKLDIEVEQTLRSWTQPEVLIIVRAAELADGRQVLYRATIGHGLGVYSELAGEEVLFAQSRPDRLVDLVVGMLPSYPPVPLAELAFVRGPSTARRDLDAAAGFSAWPLHRYGTFELSVRHGQGALHPVGTATFVDNDGGRFLMFTDPLPGGEERLRFIPSDGSHLRTWLHEARGASH